MDFIRASGFLKIIFKSVKSMLMTLARIFSCSSLPILIILLKIPLIEVGYLPK